MFYCSWSSKHDFVIHWVPLTTSSVTTNTCLYTGSRLQRVWLRRTPVCTLGPAYNEFGYNEHMAIMNMFFALKSLTAMLRSSVTTNSFLVVSFYRPYTKYDGRLCFQSRQNGVSPLPARDGVLLARTGWGTLLPPDRTAEEYLLRSGRYASCVHAGGLLLLIVCGSQYNGTSNCHRSPVLPL